MDNAKILEVLIKNGEAIIASDTDKDSLFETWYEHAEAALKKVFGEDWKAFVLWEGYKSEFSYSRDKNRIRRAVDSIKNSMSLIPTSVTIKDAKLLTEDLIKENESSEKQQIFIVHGHDEITKLELKNYLQNTLKLPEPIILHEKPNHGKTIIEKFEEHASKSTMAFVLLTPDDKILSSTTNKEDLYRARQNVILELGYFIGVLGRKSGKVILLFKGKLDIPSDIAGLIYIDVTHGVEAAGEKIRREL
jgi:predicted nucleotide-binding protein